MLVDSRAVSLHVTQLHLTQPHVTQLHLTQLHVTQFQQQQAPQPSVTLMQRTSTCACQTREALPPICQSGSPTPVTHLPQKLTLPRLDTSAEPSAVLQLLTVAH